MNFIGNEKALKFLQKCIERENISQAYFFSGPESVGKFFLAKKFAKSIINREEFPGNFEDEKKPLDLLIIEPEVEKGKEKSIKIEQIVEAQKDLSLYPYEGRFKILIINNAHKMNDSAQNALLKILEEPNATSIIILVTHEENRMLPTIKSRCQRINLSLVESELMVREMKKQEDDLSDKMDVINLSIGRPGKAIEMFQDDSEYRKRKEELNSLSEIMENGINSRLKKAEEMSNDVKKSIETLELWMWIFNFNSRDNNQARLAKMRALEKIEETLKTLKNTNANAKMTLENLLINL